MDEVPLNDEPLPREKRRRPRWVDVAGLVAAAGVVIVVGSLGGRGDDDALPPPTSTTLSTSTTTTTTEPTTTTTTEPNPIVFGQLLPRKTGTVVALIGETTKLLDLDSGTLVTTGWASSAIVPGDHGFLFLVDDEIRLVSSAGTIVETHPGRSLESWFVDDRGGAWLRSPPEYTSWLHIDGRGRETGTTVSLPFDANPVASVDDGLIVTMHGSSTLVTFDGRRRSLGAGDVVAGFGHTIARIRCEELRCHIEIEDVATGRVRRVSHEIEDAGWAHFASGGRWLQVFRSGPSDQPISLLDLRSMEMTELDAIHGPTAFTVDGGYLLAVDGGILRAYDLDAHTWIELNQIGSTAGQLIATAR